MQDYASIQNLDLRTVFLLFEPIAISIILLMVFFEWRRTRRSHYLLLSIILILSLMKFAYHSYISTDGQINKIMLDYQMLLPHTLELIIIMFLGPALLNRYIMNIRKTTNLMAIAIICLGVAAVSALYIEFYIFTGSTNLLIAHKALALAQLIVAFYPFIVLTGVLPSLLRMSGFNTKAAPQNIKSLSMLFGFLAIQKALIFLGITTPSLISKEWSEMAANMFSSLFFVSLIVLVYKEIIDELLDNYESSITDKLTKVYNQGYLSVRMKEEVFRATRYNRPLSFAMLDLDYFKNYNDKFGHTQGDVLLRELARRVKGELRKTDLFFRYGGEEFSILFLDTGVEKALEIAERIRSSIENMKARSPVTLSIGLSSIACGCIADAEAMPIQAYEDLIIRADEALYQAKARGRNTVVPCNQSVEKLRTLSPETQDLIAHIEMPGTKRR